MHLLRIAKFHESMEETAIGPWHVAVGETVAAGQILVELITDKSVIELEAPVSGILMAQLAAEKSVVPVGTVIAAIGEAGEPIPDGIDNDNQRLREARHEAWQTPASPAPPPPAPAKPTATVQAAPAARQLAREQGIELADVAAWCGKSLVHLKDVEGYLNAKRS